MSESTAGSKKPVVAVVGAGGRTGRETIKLLLAEGYQVIGLTRPQSQVEDLAEAGVEIRRADVRQDGVEKLAEALKGCEIVICTLGAKPPFDPISISEVEEFGVKKLVEATQQVGATHFILTSSLGASNPPSIPFLTAVLEVKQKAEQYLVDSGLVYTVVRPGGLQDTPSGKSIQAGKGDTIRGMVSRSDVAKVLVEAIDRVVTHNQIFEIINSDDPLPPWYEQL